MKRDGCLFVLGCGCGVTKAREELTVPAHLLRCLEELKVRLEPANPRDPPLSTHLRAGLTVLWFYTWLSYVDPELSSIVLLFGVT